jgi:hypothetical protein
MGLFKQRRGATSRRQQRRNDGSRRRKLIFEVLEERQLLSVNVTTYHNDLTRQGLNSAEVALTPANVNSSSFGKLFSYSVAGQIFAEPLYVSNLAIPGQGTHNVVFVATEDNDVYAFDATSNTGPNGGLLWHVNLGPSAPTPNLYFGTRYGPYSDIKSQVGITSTPVIDLSTGTMYIDSFTNDATGIYSHHIWALDITTGQEKLSHVLVTAAVNGNGAGSSGGVINFTAKQQLQRPALTLVNGEIYVAYSGYADTDPYTGWVLGFNAATLQLNKVLDTAPNFGGDSHEGEAGIWQSGNGFSSDGTHLYVMTGNGDFQTSVGDYGDSFLELTPDNSTQPTNKNGTGLTVTDSFTPFNEQMLADDDTDLGSGGTMFLPDQPGPHPHLLIGTGKQGVIYVVDRDSLGGFNASTDNVVQKVTLGQGTWSSPAYFNNMIYYSGSGGVLKAFQLTNGVLSAATIGQGSTSYPFPGATPSISSDGNANGIVWDIQYDSSHAVLRAYNATPNGTSLTELYDSNQNAARDQLAAGVKMVTPMIADGHVFVASGQPLADYNRNGTIDAADYVLYRATLGQTANPQNSGADGVVSGTPSKIDSADYNFWKLHFGESGVLTVYGLLSPPNAAPAAPLNFAATAPATIALQVQLSWTDNSTNESAFKIERSTDGTNFTQIDVASANATSYVDMNVVSGTTYTYRIRATNPVGDSDYTSTASATPIALTSPVDLYHFDEGAGTTTVDSLGGKNGTLVGTTTPAWIIGRDGTAALSFSGDGLYNKTNQSAVQVSSTLSTALGSTSTLDVWVKTTQVGSNTHSQAPAITGVDQASGTSDIDWGTINAVGKIGIFVGDTGGVYSTNPINDGAWHNVAMTRNATTGIVQLYIDGVLNGAAGFEVGSKTSQFSLIGALTDLNSSGTFTGANFFNGQLDEVRIYNRVLTPTEIAEIGQVPAAPTGLAANPYSGSINQLTWANASNFAQNVEVQRKTGAGGTYQQIALLSGSATGYTDINLDAGTQYYYRVRAIDLAGSSDFSNEANATPPRPTIVSRLAFYNKSNWDGQNGSSNIADNLAIATDKQALLPGQTATFQNYTSYSNGLNGVIIDVRDFEGVISEDDFTLLVGNSNDIGTWQPAPDPTIIAMYPGFGVGGTTRFELLWDNNEIENEWLQVTLKADAVTKLAAPDVFYFGNAIGESGNSPTDATVDAADVLAAQNNHTGPGGASITNPYDYNRDKQVDDQDELVAQSNPSGMSPLQLITAPAAGAGSAAGLIAAPLEANTVAVPITSDTVGQSVSLSASSGRRANLVDATMLTMFSSSVGSHYSKSLAAVTGQDHSSHETLIDEALLLFSNDYWRDSSKFGSSQRTSDAYRSPDANDTATDCALSDHVDDVAIAADVRQQLE